MADLIERDAALAAVNYSTKMRNCIEECISDIPAVNQWIPCSERLPEDDLNVLVSWNNRYIKIGYIETCEAIKYWCIPGHSIVPIDYITHWMPIPEPPESEAQE